MAERKDMIKNGDDISLDGGNVIVINKGISLAEKAAEVTPIEAPVAEVTPIIPANDDPIIPSVAAATEVNVQQPVAPEIAPIEIPVAPVDIPVTPAVEPSNIMPLPDYSQPVTSTQSFGTTFSADAIVGSNDFSASFDGVSYEKVGTTIVTKDDAKLAREAYLNKAAELYDMGPGNQIGILMEAASKMDKLLEEVDTQGFVSGPNHEAIKKVRLEYRGLKEIDNTKSYSDPEGPKFGGMVA